MKQTSTEASQRDRALVGLRGLILRGSLTPGERVSEIPLSKELGVSRTPLRIALDRLCREGLLEPVNSGGFRVRAFFLQDVWDALELRGVMEGEAARLAAERLIDAAELDLLIHPQAELSRLSQVPRTEGIPFTIEQMGRYGELNAAFHEGVVTLAKSPMLRRTLKHLYTLPFAAPGAVVSPGSAEGALVSHDQHEQIIKAIEAGEGARAENLTREHAHFATQSIKDALAETSYLHFGEELALNIPKEISMPVRWASPLSGNGLDA